MNIFDGPKNIITFWFQICWWVSRVELYSNLSFLIGNNINCLKYIFRYSLNRKKKFLTKVFAKKRLISCDVKTEICIKVFAIIDQKIAIFYHIDFDDFSVNAFKKKFRSWQRKTVEQIINQKNDVLTIFSTQNGKNEIILISSYLLQNRIIVVITLYVIFCTYLQKRYRFLKIQIYV